MTHDYKRNGTTTLFAALDVLTGKVIGECHPRHRNREFLRFLRTIDREVPKRQDIHLILDNYGTHGHPNVKSWLAKHPRFQLHFVPTSSSWLNTVECWFGLLTEQAIRRGSFGSVPELIAAIQQYLDNHNGDPKPFIWTATVEEDHRQGSPRACCSPLNRQLIIRRYTSLLPSGRSRMPARAAV